MSDGEIPIQERNGLHQFGFEHGVEQPIGSNTPIMLDNPELIWLIHAGKIDVFAIRMHDGKIAGNRQHLFRVAAGDVLIGIALEHFGREIALVAVGVHNTVISAVSRVQFEELLRAGNAETIQLLDKWVDALSSSIEEGFAIRQYVPLEKNTEVKLEANDISRPRRGILWARALKGAAQFLDRTELPLATADDILPISDRTFVKAQHECVLYAVDTYTFIQEAFSWRYIENFHRMLLNVIVWDTYQERIQEAERLKRRIEFDRQHVTHAIDRLASVLQKPESALELQGNAFEFGSPLVTACKIVGEALGVKVEPRHDPVDGREESQTLETIIRTSGIRTRQVALRDDWWQHDNGPLLAYIEEDKRPVALVPTSLRSYDLIDPTTKAREHVNATVAARLSPFAQMFYRALPHEPLSGWDLLRFGLRGLGRDVFRLIAMGIAGGLLTILVPLATARIFDVIIPSADRTQLTQFGLILLVAAIAGAIFQLVRNIAVLRIEIKLDAAVQSAVWDRLMNLPTPFFRDYTAGDLSNRAMGINLIRRTVSGTVISAVLSTVFSIFNFILLFVFDSGLALAATVLILISFFVSVLSGYLQMRHRRKLAAIQGYISGMVLQFITGISKLRVAGVEGRAFAHWAQHFSEQRKLAFRAGNLADLLTVFNTSYPIIATMVIFALAVSARDVSTGIFLAFYAAFTQFLIAGLELSTALISVLDIVPTYERVKPILAALPEVDETKSDPDELTGEIEVSRVSFRYKEDGPLILGDVSFHVAPGDFVALVGPSGSGKSTLFRLLLGFEKPESGAIFYGGQDLSGLDIRAVRQQLGVVLQNSQLMTGDIFDNIVGVAPLTMDDAWEAARMAGLEHDIRNMPMGMHTVISEGGSTFSGGQRQRLLIARAIAKRPRILYFDEATSALDNRTQAIVSQSLQNLDATRIVIAHRLSTIINADKILVMDQGRLVQQGTYEQLIRQKGMFADLARRQLV